MNEKDAARDYAVYEAMKQAVPDDNNIREVIRAAELIIADCIAQAGVSKEVEERTYKVIVDDIKELAEIFKTAIEKGN